MRARARGGGVRGGPQQGAAGAGAVERAALRAALSARLYAFPPVSPTPPPTQHPNSNLSDLINERHENTKYLPGFPLGDNVVACPSLEEAARWVGRGWWAGWVGGWAWWVGSRAGG